MKIWFSARKKLNLDSKARAKFWPVSLSSSIFTHTHTHVHKQWYHLLPLIWILFQGFWALPSRSTKEECVHSWAHTQSIKQCPKSNSLEANAVDMLACILQIFSKLFFSNIVESMFYYITAFWFLLLNTQLYFLPFSARLKVKVKRENRYSCKLGLGSSKQQL